MDVSGREMDGGRGRRAVPPRRYRRRVPGGSRRRGVRGLRGDLPVSPARRHPGTLPVPPAGQPPFLRLRRAVRRPAVSLANVLGGHGGRGRHAAAALSQLRDDARPVRGPGQLVRRARARRRPAPAGVDQRHPGCRRGGRHLPIGPDRPRLHPDTLSRRGSIRRVPDRRNAGTARRLGRTDAGRPALDYPVPGDRPRHLPELRDPAQERSRTCDALPDLRQSQPR